MMILRVFSGKFALLYYLQICYNFIRQEYHMSTLKNTFKNRKLLDEGYFRDASHINLVSSFANALIVLVLWSKVYNYLLTCGTCPSNPMEF